MATHSSILAERIPRTEEPGGLQSVGSQRIRHNWVTFSFTWQGKGASSQFRSSGWFLRRGFQRMWGWLSQGPEQRLGGEPRRSRPVSHLEEDVSGGSPALPAPPPLRQGASLGGAGWLALVQPPLLSLHPRAPPSLSDPGLDKICNPQEYN